MRFEPIASRIDVLTATLTAETSVRIEQQLANARRVGDFVLG